LFKADLADQIAYHGICNARLLVRAAGPGVNASVTRFPVAFATLMRHRPITQQSIHLLLELPADSARLPLRFHLPSYLGDRIALELRRIADK
jgi:hypothetical protein